MDTCYSPGPSACAVQIIARLRMATGCAWLALSFYLVLRQD